MAKQKSKHNNEEPKFNFDPLPNHKDSLASEIKEKVEDAKKSKSNRTFASMGNISTFPVIRIHIDKLLYNLENDRTIYKCEEHPKAIQDISYFSNQNVWNKENQNEYHKIIYSFVPKEMGDILAEQANQRDPIFITSNGVIANGNTRIACIREFKDYTLQEIFKNIECCVIPEEDSNDWTYIRTLVDEMDNQKSFKTEYPWYSRARRFELNCFKDGHKNILLDEEVGGPPKSKLEAIAKRMQYSNLIDAKKHYQMLLLAREFIDSKLLRFEKITDLNKLGEGGGGGDGYQVFKTLAENIKKIQDDDELRTEVIKTAFGTIATNAQTKKAHKMPSQHLAVQSLFGKSFLEQLKKTLNPTSNEDVFTSGGKKSKPKKANKKNIFKNSKSGEDIYDEIKTNLTKAAQLKDKDAGKAIQDSYEKRMKEAHKSFKDLRELSLKDDSSLANAKDIIKAIKKELEKHESKIESIIESRA
tara:strand:- start:1287 stop:2702 length:1416 start_codon:yes stop_codon:yes gene_type:complete